MNVTYQLDDELLKRAKVVATRRDTSVAQLVREGLEQQVAFGAPMQRPGAQVTYETLVGYALGEIPRGVVMDALGLDHCRELLSLLGAAGLPMPTVPAATRAEMVAGLIDALKAAGALSEDGKRTSSSAGLGK
ncbi:MAG: ribbon-helix-helix domain-containing protein [Rhodoferax sp.]|nr:ribbon-helix-helix domain-containing protein [Rhodoferax sp.]